MIVRFFSNLYPEKKIYANILGLVVALQKVLLMEHSSDRRFKVIQDVLTCACRPSQVPIDFQDYEKKVRCYRAGGNGIVTNTGISSQQSAGMHQLNRS